jgi:uncharacterized protein (TIGR02145 family)
MTIKVKLVQTVFTFALAFVFSCSSLKETERIEIEYNAFDYEDKTYKTVKINEHWWMAENLNYAVEGSKCGTANDTLTDNNTEYCDTYGRLYNWATVMALPEECNRSRCAEQIETFHKGICPYGWHISSDTEWTALTNFVGSNAGIKLRAKNGWNSGGYNGTDVNGFAALPGGQGISSGGFGSDGNYGKWWNASEYDATSAYYRYIGHIHKEVGRNNINKIDLFSIRCVKDY